MNKVVVWISAVAVSVLALMLIPASGASAAFGLGEFDVTFTGAPPEGSPRGTLGPVDNRAGSHPFALTTAIVFNQVEEGPDSGFPDGGVKDLFLEQMPGLVGNLDAVPRCSTEDFLHRSAGSGSACSFDTIVGTTSTAVGRSTLPQVFEEPLYNLEPAPGVAQKVGFFVATVPVTIDLTLSKKPPYRVVARATNLSNALTVGRSKVTLWGNPGDPRHDSELACNPDCEPRPQVAYITTPRSCSGPVSTTYVADAWEAPGVRLPDGNPDLTDPSWITGSDVMDDGGEPPAPIGWDDCQALEFDPAISSQPTASAGDSPSGLDFSLDVEDPGLVDPEGRADSDIEKAVVTLPEGMTTNSSVASGLQACSLAQYESETVDSAPGTGCPQASKLGSVEVETPLLAETSLHGSIFVAKQKDNPFGSLLALYMVIKDPELGILIQQAGRVDPDPVTGQLTTTFSNLPELPFSHFRLHFREGPRAPLTTPPTCGTYTTEAKLFPHEQSLPVVTQTSSFEIRSGANGGPCAATAAELPNQPAFSAGTTEATAGAFSPFVLRLNREDGSQLFSSIATTLPEGLLGKLAGIPYCPEDRIALAASRSGEGQGAEELSSPSCPSESEVGTVVVGAGAGSKPLYVQGRAYLAGPYGGAPLSLAIVTPAIAGPFDLGVVTVRTRVQVNPMTAQITAVSDPIPTILHGLPLNVRSIAVDMTRPNFTLNPTSCRPKSIAGSAVSTLSQSAPLSQYFQVAGCSRLKFAPKLAFSLEGATRRAGHPALKAVLTFAKGSSANIARAQVGLPHSEFLDQGNIKSVCTQPQLKAATCPKKAIYGRAKAWSPLLDKPLEGPVYLGVGYGHALPDLVADLNGQIRVLLNGRVDTTKRDGLRTTFETVPDAPVSKFVLELKGGPKKGLIENSENLCNRKQRAAVRLHGQNGRVHTFRSRIRNGC